jgi:hypothetical protein
MWRRRRDHPPQSYRGTLTAAGPDTARAATTSPGQPRPAGLVVAWPVECVAHGPGARFAGSVGERTRADAESRARERGSRPEPTAGG